MGKKHGARAERSPRAEKFAREWAAAIHVELLTAWGRRDDDSPMPTRQDAERIARERTDLLVDGLGDWAEKAPKLLDLNQRTVRGRRRWYRNAWPTQRRDDRDGTRWWYRWIADEDDC